MDVYLVSFEDVFFFHSVVNFIIQTDVSRIIFFKLGVTGSAAIRSLLIQGFEPAKLASLLRLGRGMRIGI